MKLGPLFANSDNQPRPARYRRSIPWFGIVLFFMMVLPACDSETGETKERLQLRALVEKDNANKKLSKMNADAAVPVAPLQSLPNGYILDTTVIENKARKHSTMLIYPHAKKASWESRQIKDHIDRLTKSYLPTPDEVHFGDNFSKFEIWVEGMTLNKYFLSIRYRSKYDDPSNHGLEIGVHLLNLDLDNKTSPKFSDIVVISTEEESDSLKLLFVLDGVYKTASMGDLDFKKNLKFDIINDTLSVYAQEKNGSIIYWAKSEIALSKIQKYLHPANKKRFDLVR